MMAMILWRRGGAKQVQKRSDRVESERLRQEMLEKTVQLDAWVASLRMEIASSERPSDDRPDAG